MTAVLDLSWADILELDSVQDDIDTITTLVVNSIGMDTIVDDTNVFVNVIAMLIAVQRYFIKNLPSVKDLDMTPFLTYLAEEVGLDLPFTPEFPMVEFLRENKAFLGSRGSFVLYAFIAALVNSPIQVQNNVPAMAILDDVNTLLDGSQTFNWGADLAYGTGWSHFNDGFTWDNFIYTVQVMQAQQLTSVTDLVNLITNIHPCGTKLIAWLRYCFPVDMTSIQPVCSGFSINITESFAIPSTVPGWDSGFELEELPGSEFDTRGHGF